jgi:hypothetical protein
MEQITIQTIMISQLLAKARYFVSWDWRENLSKDFQYLLVVLPNMVSLDYYGTRWYPPRASLDLVSFQPPRQRTRASGRRINGDFQLEEENETCPNGEGPHVRQTNQSVCEYVPV